MEFLFHFYALIFFKLQKNGNIFEKIIILHEMKNRFFQRNIFQKSSSVIFEITFWVWISPSGVKSGGFGAKLHNLKKNLGFWVLNVSFQVFFRYQFLGLGRVQVAKRSDFTPRIPGFLGSSTHHY